MYFYSFHRFLFTLYFTCYFIFIVILLLVFKFVFTCLALLLKHNVIAVFEKMLYK